MTLIKASQLYLDDKEHSWGERVVTAVHPISSQ